MKNALIINGHPDIKSSVANRTILEELKVLLPNVTIRNINELYPDSKFDITVEQDALVAYDIIVWQFPFHWYSLPGRLKLWVDEVFIRGFAHGSTGTALKDKTLLISFTTGAPASLYQHGKAMNYTIKEFINNIEQTANLCYMKWAEPIYSTGMTYIEGVNPPEDKDRVISDAKDHAARLAKAIA